MHGRTGKLCNDLFFADYSTCINDNYLDFATKVGEWRLIFRGKTKWEKIQGFAIIILEFREQEISLQKNILYFHESKISKL